MKTLLILAPLVFVLAACSGSEDSRPPPSGGEKELEVPRLEDFDLTTGDSRNYVASGSCTDGDTQECRVYLPTHNDIQPCFVGEQLCEGDVWGDCGNAVLVDVNANDEELFSDDLQD